MIILLATAKASWCSEPKKNITPQKDAQGSITELALRRKIRHENRLKENGLKKFAEEPIPAPTIIPVIKKPARGCLSRTRKLVLDLFSYCTATTNNQD